MDVMMHNIIAAYWQTSGEPNIIRIEAIDKVGNHLTVTLFVRDANTQLTKIDDATGPLDAYYACNSAHQGKEQVPA
jgi:hypothetical protein